MKAIWDKIARRTALVRARYHFEIKRKDLDTGDVESRLRPELRGRCREPRFYSDLFRHWLGEAPDTMRVVKASYMTADGDALRAGRIEVLGRRLDTAAGLNWQEDPLFGVEWPRKYVGALSGLARGSDVVLLWHLNKMIFLLDASYACRVTGDDGFARRWVEWVDSWVEQNPFMLGMNWRSPLEIGTRLVVWSIGLQEIGFTYSPSEASLQRIVRSLIRQAEYVAANFSHRDPSNNHLIGEAATLYAFAAWWPLLDKAPAWRRECEDILEHEIKRQVLPDGMHFENAFNYHAYVLDFYLLYLYAKCLQGESPRSACLDGVTTLAQKFLAFRSPSGRIPRFGDDSIEEFLILKPMREIEDRRFAGSQTITEIVKPEFAEVLTDTEWGRKLMQTESPSVTSAYCRDSGFSVIRGETSHVVYAAGPEHRQPFSHGHLHSDTGSFELEIDGVPVFIDSGTYLYAHDPASRLHFKGARAHNRLLIDDREPMISLETFKWVNTVRGRTLWFSGAGDCKAVGSLQVLPSNRDEFHHERLLVQAGDRVWIVIDRLSAPHRDPDAATHRAGLLFHTPLAAECFEPRDDTRVVVRLPGGPGGGGSSAILEGFSSAGYERGIISDHSDRRAWYSPAYGELKHGTTVGIGADFANGLMLVHTFAGEDVRFECRPQNGDRVAVDVIREGRRDELTVYFAPMRIDWNQRSLVEDR